MFCYKVAVNANHKLISKILTADEEHSTQLAKQAFDLALLSQGMLIGADLTAFVERSVNNLTPQPLSSGVAEGS